jgi:hypothetical protein
MHVKGIIKKTKILAIVMALGCSLYYLLCSYLTLGTTKIATFDNVNLYVDNVELKEDILLIMDTCMAKLKMNNIFIKSKINIVFCTSIDTYNQKTFYMRKGSLGNNMTFFRAILLSPADYKNNKQNKYHEKLLNRKLSDAVVHELTHTYIREQISVLKNLQMIWFKKWKSEGFCEYVTHSSSFPIHEGKQIFLEKKNEPQEKLLAITYFYLKSRIKVDYLLSFKKISFLELMNTDFDEEKLEAEIRESMLSENFVFDQQ